MKHVILLSTLLLALFSCSEKSNSEKKINSVTYGESFDASRAQDISQLSSLMETTDSVSIVLSGTIEKTCAVKGCWMQLRTGEKNNLRVTFKDYSFFVPKSGAEGNKAVINGFCVKQETSVEELRHYAKDAGESDEAIALITEPKMEYNFVASGVIIEN
ncbi:MAG: DUF4920 domain-containing protein [Reichenbachiella sp.]|uniref:DUF4920 domain-containing protein n=1 Tax=Reichenbachiella sp. TaxID=2184521 RepID=UPI0029670202|nr:DUF4920 domain-containing protein [Reichenbachiella sp.]MDW3208221.1 DUF4920 domain-containing protein [Reichenbachiella sp.]